MKSQNISPSYTLCFWWELSSSGDISRSSVCLRLNIISFNGFWLVAHICEWMNCRTITQLLWAVWVTKNFLFSVYNCFWLALQLSRVPATSAFASCHEPEPLVTDSFLLNESPHNMVGGFFFCNGIIFRGGGTEFFRCIFGHKPIAI